MKTDWCSTALGIRSMGLSRFVRVAAPSSWQAISVHEDEARLVTTCCWYSFGGCSAFWRLPPLPTRSYPLPISNVNQKSVIFENQPNDKVLNSTFTLYEKMFHSRAKRGNFTYYQRTISQDSRNLQTRKISRQLLMTKMSDFLASDEKRLLHTWRVAVAQQLSAFDPECEWRAAGSQLLLSFLQSAVPRLS